MTPMSIGMKFKIMQSSIIFLFVVFSFEIQAYFYVDEFVLIEQQQDL